MRSKFMNIEKRARESSATGYQDEVARLGACERRLTQGRKKKASKKGSQLVRPISRLKHTLSAYTHTKSKLRYETPDNFSLCH